MHIYQILIMIDLILMTNGAVFRLEAYSGRAKVNHKVLDLSNATNGKAVLLRNGEHLSLAFCLRTSSIVQVSNFRFSNGNKPDTVMVKLDDETANIFATNNSTQSDWNRFMSTGRFSAQSYLDIGLNIVQILVNANDDGLAVDYIEIDVEDDLMTQEIAMCEVTCINNFNPNWPKRIVSEGLSYAMQKSYRTTCSEVNNVHIPIFDTMVKTYEITAAMPQYNSFSNPRDENISECYHLHPIIWTFRSISIYNNMSGSYRSVNAEVVFRGGPRTSSGSYIQMNVTFNVEGQSKGSTDAVRGSILTIELSGITKQTIIQMKYKGRVEGAALSTEQKNLSQSKPDASWSIPDFTWTDTGLNSIYLYINYNSSLPLTINNLSLARRPLLPDKVVEVYKDDDIIVETVAMDLWWLAPDSMKLVLSNGNSYMNVSYFKIYKPTIWNPRYAQLFVMYHDGNIRLLPIPPDGVDWIPFGSSIIVGQSNPSNLRPYAAITNVYLNVQSLQMDVTYKDGGSAKLELQNNLMETRLIVSDIVFGPNINYPFATFASMYVADGNCDVDHVIVDDANPRHIMEPFEYLIGRSFVFYRKCTSKHLNLSPDIYIHIKRSR